MLCTSTLKCTLSPPTTTFQIWNHLHHNGKKHLHCGEKTKIPKTLLKDFWRTRGQPHTQIQNVHLSQLQLLSDYQLSFSNFQISSMYPQPSHSLPSVPLLLYTLKVMSWEAKQAETRLLISDCVWYLIHGTTCYFWKLFSPTALQRNIARYQITLVSAQGSGLSQTTDQSVILRLLFQDCL